MAERAWYKGPSQPPNTLTALPPPAPIAMPSLPTRAVQTPPPAFRGRSPSGVADGWEGVATRATVFAPLPPTRSLPSPCPQGEKDEIGTTPQGVQFDACGEEKVMPA